ncbi:hypothetical protein DL93DRAFT_2097186 [Clavulina sp. PMI_390]|nr:hypothetical protein DL93DRAFT_2097186 [Clavulina sp. PMI_390]
MAHNHSPTATTLRTTCTPVLVNPHNLVLPTPHLHRAMGLQTLDPTFASAIASSIGSTFPFHPSVTSAAAGNTPPHTPITISNRPVSSPWSSLSSGNIPALSSPVSENGPNTTNGSSSTRNWTRSAPSTPSIKAVHFTEKDSVVLFEKSQRPAAVSFTGATAGSNGAPPLKKPMNVFGGESETETERDSDGVLGLFGVSLNRAGASSVPVSSSSRRGVVDGYPFPSLPSGSGSSAADAASMGMLSRVEIAKGKSSDVAAVPGTISPSLLQASDDGSGSVRRVILESVSLVTPPSSSTTPPSTPDGTGDEVFKGTILVENVSFGKSVHVRFTLDEWQTTSEVGATYVDSLPVQAALAPHSRSRSEPYLSRSRSRSPSPHGNREAKRPRQWDRFAFSINLSSVRHLHTRRLFLVVRYNPQSWGPHAEFWDNNDGKNYCFVFERVKRNPTSMSAVSVPTTSSAVVRPSADADDDDDDDDEGQLPAAIKARVHKSSMPVSPSAIRFKAQMDARALDGEAEMANARKIAGERPVPRLPPAGSGSGFSMVAKSASAPAIHRQQHLRMHSFDVASGGREFDWEHPNMANADGPAGGRPRGGSVDTPALVKEYPQIHLKLSNYISPTATRASTSPLSVSTSPVTPPTRSRLSSPPPPPVERSSSSELEQQPEQQQQQQRGAPLSPPDSPIAERIPSPPTPTRVFPPTTDSMTPAAIKPPTRKPKVKVSQNTEREMQREKDEAAGLSTPPESANTSPEPAMIPLPGSSTSMSSSSPSSSDSDRSGSDSLKFRFGGTHSHVPAHHFHGPSHQTHNAHHAHANHHQHHHHHPHHAGPGNYYRRSMVHPPASEHAPPKDLGARRNGAPTGLNFPAAIPQASHAKFTVGSPGSASSSVTVSPAVSPEAALRPTELSFSALSELQTKPTDGGNPLNNAPPEFLEKFCFFGSPEPSPTHTPSTSSLLIGAANSLAPNGSVSSAPYFAPPLSPPSQQHPNSQLPSLNGPVMFADNILPGATVGMGHVSMADTYYGYRYGVGQGSGAATPMRGVPTTSVV